MKLFTIVIFFLFFEANFIVCKLTIYTESYTSIKESHFKNINEFIERGSELKVEINNDSIINQFIYLFSKVAYKNKFVQGQTGTIFILENKNVKDTIILNRGDSRIKEYRNLIILTEQFFPLEYKIR